MDNTAIQYQRQIFIQTGCDKTITGRTNIIEDKFRCRQDRDKLQRTTENRNISDEMRINDRKKKTRNRTDKKQDARSLRYQKDEEDKSESFTFQDRINLKF